MSLWPFLVCLCCITFEMGAYATARTGEGKARVMGSVRSKFTNNVSLAFNHASGSFQQDPPMSIVSSTHHPPLANKNPSPPHKLSSALSSPQHEIPKKSKKHKKHRKKVKRRIKLPAASNQSNTNTASNYYNKNNKAKQHSTALTYDKHHSRKKQGFHLEPISLQINVQIELSEPSASTPLPFSRQKSHHRRNKKAQRKSLGQHHGWFRGPTFTAVQENSYLHSQPSNVDPSEPQSFITNNQPFIHLYLPLPWLAQTDVNSSQQEESNVLSSGTGHYYDHSQNMTTTTTARTTTITPTRSTSPPSRSTVGAGTHTGQEFPRSSKKHSNKHSYAKVPSLTPANRTAKAPRRKKQPNAWTADRRSDNDEVQRLLAALDATDAQAWTTWFQCALCLSTTNKDLPTDLCPNVACQDKLPNDLTSMNPCLDTDMCTQWIECERSAEPLISKIFSQLPSCPCLYPSQVVYQDRIWDAHHRRHFRWRDVNLETERLDVYRPGAAYCIRSLTPIDKAGLAAQQCCYDHSRSLLTRGWAAGTPSLVSMDVSRPLHHAIDRKPWLACKGDFTRFHLQRQPNNHLNCSINPTDDVFQRQVLLATNY